MKVFSFLAAFNVARNAAIKLQKSTHIDDVANVSLFLIYPGLFFYQAMIGARLIEPIFYGGWGKLMLLLLPVLSLCYLVKVAGDRWYFSKVEYIFFVFLLYISTVSLYFYMMKIPNENFGALLLWNLGGVISNLTCFLAFRLANVNKLSFKILFGLSAFCMMLIVLFNTDFKDLFFGFMAMEYLFTYQGFARSMLIVFFIACFSCRSGLLAFLCFCVFAFALIVNSSRTELILFVCAVPVTLIITHRAFQNMKCKHLFYLGVVFLGCGFLGLLFAKSGIFDGLPYLRILALADPMNDLSFQYRLSQSIAAVNTLMENPFFGSYGSYVKLNSIGNYSHGFLNIWVNMGLIGAMFYLALIIAVIGDVFRMKFTLQNRTLIYLSVALGLSAVVAHLFSYVYVQVLLAAAIGSIARAKEMQGHDHSKPASGRRFIVS